MAIFSRTTAKVHLGIASGDTSRDTFLDQIGPQCEAALLNKLKIIVEQTTVTEFLPGTGKNRLFLRRTPVQSITTIHARSDLYYGDGSAPTSADLLTAGTDYALARDQEFTGSNIKSKSGIVYRIGGVWERPRGSSELLASGLADDIGNIKVVYVAGYSSVPADISLALNQMIAVLNESASQGGALQSESLDYWSGTKFSPADMARALGSVSDLIAPYKKLVISA